MNATSIGLKISSNPSIIKNLQLGDRLISFLKFEQSNCNIATHIYEFNKQFAPPNFKRLFLLYSLTGSGV